MLLHYIGLFRTYIGLFFTCIGLFHTYIGLFFTYIGLFCTYIGLFFTYIGLFLHLHRVHGMLLREEASICYLRFSQRESARARESEREGR